MVGIWQVYNVRKFRGHICFILYDDHKKIREKNLIKVLPVCLIHFLIQQEIIYRRLEKTFCFQNRCCYDLQCWRRNFHYRWLYYLRNSYGDFLSIRTNPIYPYNKVNEHAAIGKYKREITYTYVEVSFATKLRLNFFNSVESISITRSLFL